MFLHLTLSLWKAIASSKRLTRFAREILAGENRRRRDVFQLHRESRQGSAARLWGFAHLGNVSGIRVVRRSERSSGGGRGGKKEKKIKEDENKARARVYVRTGVERDVIEASLSKPVPAACWLGRSLS